MISGMLPKDDNLIVPSEEILPSLKQLKLTEVIVLGIHTKTSVLQQLI